MEVYSVKTTSILPLGKQGENLVRQIQFDLSRWISNFGPGTVQLLHQRSGDEAPYPVAVEQEGNLAVWTVTSADTAAAGTGRAELQYYVGDALAKSETWMTKVLAALGPAGEIPPEAQQGWVDQVLAQVARITGMTAQAVELPAGSAPTADYADGVLTIGIPLGGDVSEAQIARAMAEYLLKHPIAETDPTVPDWAKAAAKPGYTALEVGADPSGTAAAQMSVHNTEITAHSDIRLLIQGLTERLNALADSDDTTLDQLSEIVAYIKSNRDLIAAVITDKVGVTDIVNDLVTNVANKPLSAAQGVALKALIDSLSEEIANLNTDGISATARNLLITILRNGVYSSDQNANITDLETALGGSDAPVVKSYAITNTLTNCTTNNAVTSVTDGGSYTATLTAADGYALNSVVVTMGGTDITSTAYSGSVITIASVTGDVSIVATAVAAESGGGETVVNLFDKDTMVVSGARVGTNGAISTSATSKYAKIPISVGTYALQKGSGWAMDTTGHPALIDSAGNVLCRFANLQINGKAGSPSEPTVGTIAQEKNGNGIAVTVLSENVTHIIFSICVNGGTDDTDTTMMEVGDTCHDYVAHV